jgi:hypothetical protein
MLQCKEKHGLSDKAFKRMLKIVKDKLPECQMVRSRQPTGVLIPVVYLFGEV